MYFAGNIHVPCFSKEGRESLMFEELPFLVVLVIAYAAVLVGTIVVAVLLKDLRN